MTRREAWKKMKEQCSGCRRHGAPNSQGSRFESPRNPDGWGHETGSYSWTSCTADNDIVAVFMDEAPSSLNIA